MEWHTLRNAPKPGTRLCQLTDIPDGEGKEFVFGSGYHAFRMFVVRRGDSAWGYINRCPHFSIPINVQPDRFVTSDHSLIMCANHTATFRYDDGYCIDGPCRGASLDPVPIHDTNGLIQIERST